MPALCGREKEVGKPAEVAFFPRELCMSEQERDAINGARVMEFMRLKKRQNAWRLVWQVAFFIFVGLVLLAGFAFLLLHPRKRLGTYGKQGPSEEGLVYLPERCAGRALAKKAAERRARGSC